jgi:peptidyl-prolyl cis-trans isomerase C
MRRIIREPLVHFLFLGALIFFTASFINNRNRLADKTIFIGNDKIANIYRLYTITNGAPPTKKQLDAMIDDYIKEEVFYRESLKMRLDKGDEIIRRRLSQKMEFLQTDLSIVPAPTESQLLAFYQNHLASFRDSGEVSFTHIYFNADKTGEEDAKRRAALTKSGLVKSNLKRAPEQGDAFSMLFDYAAVNKLDIIQLFGNKPILDSLFASPLQQWIGPVESGYGWHLLYINQRKEGSVSPYQLIKTRVNDQYIAVTRDSLNKAAYEKLEGKYDIIRDYLKNNE